tara:strand:+ start:143 stop:322 length:180 start_codon:yes stop_codon:yes gene_type:complete
MAITSSVMDDYDQQVYQSGYIDGLQTAIRLLSEDNSTMSYSVEMEEIFDDGEIDDENEY